MLAFLAALGAPVHAQVFVDETAARGLSGLSGTNGSWADYDGDGDVDLYVYGQFWQNDGTGHFTLDSVGVAPPGPGYWGDCDNDGDLDLLTFAAASYLHINDGTGWFTDASHQVETAPMYSSLGGSMGDFDGDGDLDLYLGGYEYPYYEEDALLVNDGNCTFTVAWTEGDASGFWRPGRGVTTADFDQDDDLDIYVSNYRLEPNYLWRNDGAGNLVDHAETLGVEGVRDGWWYSYGHTIGSAWGDLDDDGYIDLFVANFAHHDWWQDRPWFLKNRGPTGNYRFWDMTGYANIWYQESHASAALGDYDNDGDLDLYFTTVYGGDAPKLYRNNGAWSFTDRTTQSGLGGIGATYQASWADVDDDGDLDLLTYGRLYINQTTGTNWLIVELVGDGVGVPVTPIGSQVRIHVADRVLTRQVESATGEGNSNDLRLHFGLGPSSDPVDLLISWQDGTRETLVDVAPNQVVTIYK